jgi:hypothetical protein
MTISLEHLTNAQLEELKAALVKLPNASNPKRKALIEKFGFDTKFAAHAVRLYLQVEQIMTEHDLDLERNGKVLTGIRNGEWELDRIIQWCADKEKQLEEVYSRSTLQHKPDEKFIKQLLLDVIEMHYGSISNSFVKDVGKDVLISELRALVDKYE